MTKTEQEYLKEISRLEEDKKTLLAENENWKTEQKASIKAYKELEKKNENLNLSATKQEEERGKDQEQITKLKERIKELTDQGRIKKLLETIKNQEKTIETYLESEKKSKETIWKKDRELEKLTEYIKRLNELVSSKDKEIKNLEEWKEHLKLYQQKITDLENALIDLARQKISDNVGWNIFLNQLKERHEEETELILKTSERTRNEQAEEIVALETENMKLHNNLEEAEKELDQQDTIIYKKDETILELKEQLKQKELQKSIIGDIDNLLKPQPRTMPILTQNDRLIIQQARGHLQPLTNSTTLRDRILEAESGGTLNDFWNLQTDLREAGEIQQKLLKHFRQDIDSATAFNYTLAKILRGEYLNEN